MRYPEVYQLTNLMNQHQVVVNPDGSKDGLKLVILSIRDKKWRLFIDDEYGDFDLGRQPLNFFLVLRSLEDYKESIDFLGWCKLYDLDPANSFWIEYFRELGGYLAEIEELIGAINCFINPLDYQLRSGAFQFLLNVEK